MEHAAVATPELALAEVPEIWKVHPNSAYRASTLGRVQSRWAKVGKGKGAGKGSKMVIGDVWKDVAGQLLPNGYLQIRLGDGTASGRVITYIHRIVLECFVGPANGLEARHLNGVPTDNRLENLAWGTGKENSADTLSHGRRPIGSRHGYAKLNEQKVQEILCLISQQLTLKEIARLYGVCPATISNIRDGLTWGHVARLNLCSGFSQSGHVLQ